MWGERQNSSLPAVHMPEVCSILIHATFKVKTEDVCSEVRAISRTVVLLINCTVSHEKEKKRSRHFTPFVVSTDGLLGKEAKTFLKKLSAPLLAENGGSRTRKFVAMSMLLARALQSCETHTSACEVPCPKQSYGSNRCHQWEDKAELSLFRL
jgi:hypothetical protein